MKCVVLILSVFFSINTFSQAPVKISRDTISLNSKEFSIHNASRGVNGFLRNAGDGVTVFTEIGKNFQFQAGANPAFVLEGDSSYTNAYLVKKSVKVWRNGLFQYADSHDGIRFDNNAGTIIFYPSVVAGEKIYIEALNGF